MKKELALYIHGVGTTEEKLINVPEDATVADVLEAAKQSGIADSGLQFYAEGADAPLPPDARLRDHGIKNKDHVHVHKCGRITVSVQFNGIEQTSTFAPGHKVKAVLKWALAAHGLTGVDADNKELRLGSLEGDSLLPEQHIGSFVSAADCRIVLFLTGIVEVQG